MGEMSLRFPPSVCMVGVDYQIIFLTVTKGIGWIEIEGERFLNEEGGILYYGKVHKIIVPGGRLNHAKKYTVVFVEYVDKCTYWPQGVEKIREQYKFLPYEGGDFQLFQFSDIHGDAEGPLETYRNARKCNLLLFNGDGDDTNEEARLSTVLHVLGEASGGNIPIIYARGNHDCRGNFAWDELDYIPTECRNGKRETFFSFRQGDLWGLVLDCGEDKHDASIEYGGTVAFEAFRKRETAYLESLIRNKTLEYAAEGIKYRIVFCHIPFVEKFEEPFNIEEDTYEYWVKLLNEMGIDMLICGHMHRNYCLPAHAAGKRDASFTTVISGVPEKYVDNKKVCYASTVFTAKGGNIFFETIPLSEENN